MTARLVAVAIAWLAAVVCAVLAFAVRSATTFAGSSSDVVLAGMVLAILSDASVGAILVLRRPGNVIGLVLMVAGLLAAVTLFAWVWGAALTEQRGHHDFLAGLASLIGALGFVPSVLVGGPLLALLFPTGRLPGPRWRWPVRAVAIAIAITLTIGILYPGPIPATAVDNPFGAIAPSGSQAFLTIGLALTFGSLPVALLLAIAAVIVRVRRSEGIERAQLKWFVAAVFAVGTFVTLGLTDGGLDVGLAAGTRPTVFDVLAVASLSLPAIAVGVAILRYRLFEIDRIISRTLSWALVTGLLGAVFVGLVVGLQALSTKVTGTNTLAVAASTLVVAAAFQPLRRRVQGQVDRRFNRARYDAQYTTDAFAAQLRDEVDLARLNAALVETVNEAVRPASATVWLRSGAEVGR
jgi:hypothetical protein